MSVDTLIARLHEQRETWLVLREAGADLPEFAVCLRRPAEADMPALRVAVSTGMVNLVCGATVNWRGFSEAELLGASIGSSDPLSFSTDLWAEVVRDRMDWLMACVDHLMAEVALHLARRGAIQGRLPEKEE